MANLQNRDPDNYDGTTEEANYVHSDTHRESNRVAPYRDGYIHGRVRERRLQEEELQVRDNNNAARGLLIGIAIASLLGLGLAALYYWNQRQEVPTQIIVPPSPVESLPPADSQEQNRTTIIEREVPQVVPVPQQPQTQTAPRVNVTVPQQPTPRQDIRVITPPVQQPARSQPNTTVNVTPSAPTQTRSNNPSTSTNQTSPDINSDTTPTDTQNSTDTPSGNDSGTNSTTNSNP